jgi:DNA-binding response OmpR family regulator
VVVTRKKLLILDDNASFAESLCDVLAQQGFDVRWSAQPSQARILVTALPVNVLLVDVNLVTASGIDVAQQFYREHLVESVVFLTGSVEMNESDIPEPLKSKSIVLHKPVDKDMLLEAIARLSPRVSESSTSTI